MSNDFVKSAYDQAAEIYNAGRDQFKNDIYLDKLNSLLPSHATILDIGCGAGKPVDRYFIAKGHKVTGIDISETMIELARRNVPDGDYVVRDMSELIDGEYTVDAVVSFYAIFHTPRETHQELFKKIESFLPKGGLLLVTMGSSDWEGKDSEFLGIDMFWSHFNPTKNREIIENAGFDILVDEIDTTGNERHQIVIAEKVEQ